MFGTLDILVNYHEETNLWIVTPQTLMDVDDPNEDPDQGTFEGAYFPAEDEGEDRALSFARDLGEHAVRSNQAKQAVVLHQGNERFYITPDSTTDRKS